MYSFDWSRLFQRRDRQSPAAANETVLALGLTSLLTDISSEMIASVLPMYLVLHLGLGPLAFGLADGTIQGAAALARLAGGILADRPGRAKAVATAGYALSAACRPLMLVSGSSLGGITAALALDRLGKGIRTAPRDRLIARSVPTEALASAFGLHRTMDAAGAMAGPLVSFAILSLLPDAWDLLFLASLAIAMVGTAAIVLLVPPPSPSPQAAETAPARKWKDWPLKREFIVLAAAASLLGLATVSDGFLFLMLQRRVGFDLAAFPLLYVGTPLVTALLSATFGRIADLAGRQRMFLGGYVALGLLYAVFLLPVPGALLTMLTVGLLGLHYAATDGVVAALAAALLPGDHLGRGLGILAMSTNVARFVASLAFGFLWSRASQEWTAGAFLALLVLALGAAAFLLSSKKKEASDA